MPEDFDGLSIARRRIGEEAKRRTGFLDLSALGLTELPAELFALRHLRRLHLGYRLAQRDGAWDFVPSLDFSNYPTLGRARAPVSAVFVAAEHGCGRI
jgi:hypothetical protein